MARMNKRSIRLATAAVVIVAMLVIGAGFYRELSAYRDRKSVV